MIFIPFLLYAKNYFYVRRFPLQLGVLLDYLLFFCCCWIVNNFHLSHCPQGNLTEILCVLYILFTQNIVGSIWECFLYIMVLHTNKIPNNGNAQRYIKMLESLALNSPPYFYKLFQCIGEIDLKKTHFTTFFIH